jgi:hypothetical protein
MNQDTVLKGWSGLQPPCGLTGKTIQEGDYVVWFPYFITDKEDPFWQYNEWPMLREAFDEWEHKDSFLARWNESVLTHIAPRVRILIDRANYLVWLAGPSPRVVLNFLAHGFTLSIPKDDWRAFAEMLLKAPQRPGEFRLPNNWRVLVRAEGDKTRVAWEPPSTFKEGRRDRILLNPSEWEALKKILQEVDRSLHQ